jgi:hypothetical protein
MAEYCCFCDQLHTIVLYYDPKFMLYINPKKYTHSISEDLQPICEKCLILFVFESQFAFDICTICKCYNESNNIITQNCSEIHSTIDNDDKFKFNSSVYPHLKDGPICKKCFDTIISKPDTQKIISKSDTQKIAKSHPFDNRECCKCKIKWANAKFPKKTDVMSWCKFVSSDIFEYGLVGQFKVKSKNNNFNKGDYLCNNCLKSLKYVPFLSIECDICHKKYQSLGNDMEGDGCAAYVRDNIIEGGYGSGYDSCSTIECIRFLTKRPENIPNNALICDNCIDILIDNGTCLDPETQNEYKNNNI